MLHEIVIVGGGFGGVRVAKILASTGWRMGEGVHITLISKSRYHTFHPNLYEVAAAYLPEAFGHLPINFLDLKFSSIYPLEEIFLDDLSVSVLEDEVTEVDFKKRSVKLKSGGQHEYDILVVGVGSETNYFNIPGLSEKSFQLKSFFDALSIRNAIDEVFMSVPKDKTIRIVIGGGGFTGCEFSSELIGYAKKLAKIHGRPESAFECVIVEASDKILGSASKWIQDTAKKRLTKLGIKFKFESPIKSVGDEDVILGDDSKLPFDILVWTAGVKANNLARVLAGVKLEKAFCMVVDPYLKILPYENVFGVGDITYCIDESTGKSLPMTASVALREAKYVAENIKRSILKKPLLKYKPHRAGFIIPLGGKYALLESHGVTIAGILPWILKHMITLHYWWGLLGFRRAWRIWRRGLEISTKND